MQRRHHYEQAFEAFLRARRIPYVAVNEARRALLPEGPGAAPDDPNLKSFDFVVYGQGQNLLVEIKGRRCRPHTRKPGLGRLESWVHADDVASMKTWAGLFGSEFRAVFLFLYWFDELPADGLFEEIVEHRGRWYALRVVGVDDYAGAMRVRSPRWGTVHVDAEHFERISHAFRGSVSEGLGASLPALEPLDA